CCCFFFFQAEDGIRDFHVMEFRRVLFRSSSWVTSSTGPLQIVGNGPVVLVTQLLTDQVGQHGGDTAQLHMTKGVFGAGIGQESRSEERRVGKEWRTRWGAHE